MQNGGPAVEKAGPSCGRVGASLWVRPEQVSQLISRIISTARNIEERASKAELGGTIASITGLADRTTETVGRVDKTFIQLRENLLRALEELIVGAEAFADFAQMLSDDPSVLLRGRTEERRELP